VVTVVVVVIVYQYPNLLQETLQIVIVVIFGVVVDVEVEVGAIIVIVVSTIFIGSDRGNVGGIFILTNTGKGTTGNLVVSSIGCGGVSIINSGQLRHG
jgi:hypothetical protein